MNERGGINESTSVVTRKRKVSINCEENQDEIKRPTLDYIKQLDGKLLGFHLKTYIE